MLKTLFIRFGKVVFERSKNFKKQKRFKKIENLTLPRIKTFCIKKMGVTAYAGETPTTRSTHQNSEPPI